MFYIEKYQEFAYFDIFFVFVQKNEKCKFLDQIDAKRNFQDEIMKTDRGEGPNCTILLQHSAQMADCKNTKSSG